MIEEFDQDQKPVKCPDCNSSPAQSGLRCHCQVCGRQWELPNRVNPERRVHACVGPDGTILFWDESRELWVNHNTGEPYPPAPNDLATPRGKRLPSSRAFGAQ
jgi:hypothetical protein